MQLSVHHNGDVFVQRLLAWKFIPQIIIYLIHFICCISSVMSVGILILHLLCFLLYPAQISRMEHQQAQQQQQYLTLEGLENSNARAVFVKLINVLLTVLQVTHQFGTYSSRWFFPLLMQKLLS